MSIGYTFPVIKTLNDVLPYIDEKNFRVKNGEEGLTYVNYSRMGDETFPEINLDAPPDQTWGHRIRRECRGIVFYTKSGKIVSRPFHKFFNVGERSSVAADMLSTASEHIVLEKLDGSMIRPLPTPHGMRWGTKMGLTDVGMLAEEFVADKDNYIELGTECLCLGVTPIFEFCSRANRIVLDYPKDRLVLLALRENVSGEYYSRKRLLAAGSFYNIEVVGADSVSSIATTMSEYVEDKRAEKDSGEGVVVLFSTGHCVKIKTDTYVRMHRAKEKIATERHLLQTFFENEIDDILPILTTEDAQRILNYIAAFTSAAGHIIEQCEIEWEELFRIFGSKRDFAIATKDGQIAPWKKSLYFSLWDGKVASVSEGIYNLIQKNLHNNKKFADMKTAMQLNTGWEENNIEE